MTKYNSENMVKELDTFGKDYKYPINVSASRISGLFGSEGEMTQGYAAVVKEGFVLLVLIPADELSGEAEYHKLPVLGMSRIKIKKSKDTDAFNVKLSGTADGERYKFSITAVEKSDKESFPKQYTNCEGFAEMITKWSKEI